MKRNVLCAAMVLLAGSLMAADKDDVSAAIAKLASADNYSWKSSSSNAVPGGGGGGGRRGGGFGGGTVDGQVQTGLVHVSMPGRGGAVTEGYVKSGKGAIKAGEDGWSSLTEATADDGGGGFNMARFAAMRLQNQKTPADDAKNYVDKSKSVTKMGDAYVAELNEEGAKALLNPFGPPRGGGGGDAPQITITDAKATVKFWVKDGVLAKYEITSSGKTQFGDQDPRDVNRVTTVEIKDVGATKIEVPDDAKKKMS